jgi:hypothetical protein
MKTMIKIILSFLALNLAHGQNLNGENIQALHGQIYENLEIDPLVIQWKSATTDEIKIQKFNEIITQVGNPPLGRAWVYPGSSGWPLINWSKVVTLEKLLDDQVDVLNQIGVVAQSDEEGAKVTTVEWLVKNEGRNMEPWFEKWLLDLAKGQNSNLKRLAFWSIRSFAEDIGKFGTTEEIRLINWNNWEEAFNQSDDLGKCLLLVCMTDLALRKEEFTKVTELHIGVFNATNDELKAIALYTGTRKLGAAIVTKWQEIADNHANPKMKALAQEALDRGV